MNHTKAKKNRSLRKLETGIPGFDFVAEGGLPLHRTTLVAGTSGSAKTVFAAQFLAAGILQFDQPGVFVTFEESAKDIRQNVAGLGWDIKKWEDEGKWAFVDASPDPAVEHQVVGGYDLGGLLARIEHAVRKVGAKRVSMDSLGGVFAQLPDAVAIRAGLLRIATALKRMGVTTVMTAERPSESAEMSRYGVEEFVADNVVILRNTQEGEQRRRTFEILKFRGARHQKGEYPFTILAEDGIVASPLSSIRLTQRSSDARISSGVEKLDTMCGGGFFRGSTILVSGATGAGKTLLSAEFAAGAAAAGQRCALFAFEESRDQLVRNARGWGKDFERMEKQGKLLLDCRYPESTSLEELLIEMRATIDRYKPDRVIVDSLSALERVASEKGFREFIIALTAFLKERQIASLFTATTRTLSGTSVSERNISTITDTIILLRYVETFGEIRRGLAVLKMRGSPHDKSIREFTVGADGMQLQSRFRNVSGILSGTARSVADDEMERLEDLFARSSEET